MAEHEQPDSELSAEVSDDCNSSLKAANGSPPALDEWKEAGASTLGLIQKTLVAFWARLRPLLDKLRSQSEVVFTKRASDDPVSFVDENKKPTAEPFPTVNQWTETGKTIFDLTKRSADTIFSKPTSNKSTNNNRPSRQAADIGEGDPSELAVQPDVSFAASQTSATGTQVQKSDGLNRRLWPIVPKVYCPVCRELTAHDTSNDFLTLSVVLTILTCGVAFPFIILAAMMPPQRRCKKCKPTAAERKYESEKPEREERRAAQLAQWVERERQMEIQEAKEQESEFARTDVTIRREYVYVLVNSSIPGLCKIGKTTCDPESRAVALSSSTGVPTNFVVAYYVQVPNCSVAEKKVHAKLAHARVNKGREFFRVDVKTAIDVVKEVCENKRPGEKGNAPLT